MRVYKKRLVEQLWLDYVVCNKCGKKVHSTTDEKGEETFDYVSLDFSYGLSSELGFGYGDVNICLICYHNLSKEFAVKPVPKFSKK